MEVEFKTEGFSELMTQIDVFCSPGIQKKMVQNSVREAIKPVKTEAELRLGKGKGYIAVGMPKRRNWGADTIASIGIGPDKKHWQIIFQEYGTKERFTKKGARRGKIDAKPFLRPSLDAKKNEALDRMKKYLELCLKAIIEQKQKMIPRVSEIV